ASDLQENVFEDRFRLLGAEFVSDHAPRALGRGSQTAELVMGIDLYHDAVDVVRETVAFGFHVGGERHDLICRCAQATVAVDGESESAEPFERLPLCLR